MEQDIGKVTLESYLMCCVDRHFPNPWFVSATAAAGTNSMRDSCEITEAVINAGGSKHIELARILKFYFL